MTPETRTLMAELPIYLRGTLLRLVRMAVWLVASMALIVHGWGHTPTWAVGLWLVPTAGLGVDTTFAWWAYSLRADDLWRRVHEERVLEAFHRGLPPPSPEETMTWATEEIRRIQREGP